MKNEEIIRYQADLLQEISDMVISTDENFLIRSWNKAAEQTYGWTEDEVIGKNIDEVLQTAMNETLSEDTARLLETGKIDVDHIHTSKDGRTIYVNSNVKLVKDTKGKYVGTVGISRDVTEQRIAEQSLKRSEARFRAVLESSSDVIYSLNTRTNRYEYVSPASEKVMGYTSEEAMAMDLMTVRSLIHPDDRLGFEASLSSLENMSEVELHYRFLMKSGEYRWLSNRVTVVRDAAGQLFRNGNVHDISERIRHDETIRYQAHLLQSISDMVISTDSNFKIKSWNKAAESTYGWRAEEVIGKDVVEVLKPATMSISLKEDYSELFEKGSTIANNIHVCKDGRKIEVSGKVQRMQDAQGNFTGIVGIIQDMTEQRKMEITLKERETHLRLAAEGASLGTFTNNLVTGKMYWSDELKALWGLSPDATVELDDDGLQKGHFPKDKPEFLRKIQTSNNPAGNGMFDSDYRHIMPDGSIKWLHVRAQTTFSENEEIRRPILTAGIVIDITDRVAIENSIREISDELQNIIESTEDYIFSVDTDNRLLFSNSSFQHFIYGQFGLQIKKGVLLSELRQYIPTWTNALEQSVCEGKMQAEIGVDGDSRIFSLSFNPVYMDSKMVEVTVFAKDITSRINSEREVIRLNSSLEQRVLERTNKLQQTVKALQDLSRLISHDLKDPIGAIAIYAHNIDVSGDIGPNTQRIKKTCSTMTRMLDDLSNYVMSADKSIQKEPINLKKSILSIFSNLQQSYDNRQVLNFETGLPKVCADKVLMEHVLHNLLSNALKFSSKKERANITVGCKEERFQYIFYIKDNGVGFDQQYAHRLFNAFERLHDKSEFEGSGIGLAIVRNIIQRHGGSTWIESKIGFETVVYFSLPKIPER